MNKKGFTLIELLAVIVILAVIFMLVFPNINKILDVSNETTSDIQISKILNSTYDYSLKNPTLLPEDDQPTYITLNELKAKGFIDSDIVDPSTKKEYSNDLVISIKNVGGNYKYDKTYSKLNGNYLYTVEYEFMNTGDYDDNRPTITVDGYDNESLLLNLDIGEEFVETKYSAVSFENEDISSKVVKNITLNSKNVSKINSDKPNVYKINYTVVDDRGYATQLVLNVHVSDSSGPVLSGLDKISIDTTVTSIDLYEGISCTDNSGDCADISVEEDIKYGVIGKYIVKYIAKDPTGNTTTEQRVVEIS